MTESGKKLLLLIEDEKELREVISLHLQIAGFEVIEAANGKEGLAAWGVFRREIALTITDFTMPKRDARGEVVFDGERMPDGGEVLEQIMLDDKNAKVVIFSSASEETQKQLIAGGAAKIVEKPCSPLTLIAAIREVIGEEA